MYNIVTNEKNHDVPLIMQRQDINKMIKHDFENLAKIANFGKDTNENFKFQIFDVKRFLFDLL